MTTVVEKFRAAKQQSAVFRQLIPRRPREKERQPPMVHSRSSSLQCHREVQRSETSPLAPPRKDWGSRSRPPLCSCQCRWINLSLTAIRPLVLRRLTVVPDLLACLRRPGPPMESLVRLHKRICLSQYGLLTQILTILLCLGHF